MITFVLGILLGLTGILQPEHFDTWVKIELIELFIDIPMVILGIRYFNGKKAEPKPRVHRPVPSEFEDISSLNFCDLCIHDSREVLPPKECYDCDGVTGFKSKYDEEPAEGTLRWYAWQERQG